VSAGRELVFGARSVLGLLVALASWVPGLPIFFLFVLPAARLRPSWRYALVSWFMKGMSRGIFFGLRVGGAQIDRCGRIDTREPVLVVGNHQSLVDIVQVNLLAEPRVPAFTTRKRYARFIPLVSGCVKLLGGPIVDPKRDPKGAVRAIAGAVAQLPHGLLIFPEGHRSRDGELLPWRNSGLLAALRARRMPVYLVVGDGLWRTRRLVDFLVHLPRVRGRAEVIGPFSPPEDVDELPAFLGSLRERMAAHLAEMRRT